MRTLLSLLIVILLGCESDNLPPANEMDVQIDSSTNTNLESNVNKLVGDYIANQDVDEYNLLLTLDASIELNNDLMSKFRALNDKKTVHPALMVHLELVEMNDDKQKYELMIGYMYDYLDGSGDTYTIDVSNGIVTKCERTGRWVS